MALKIVSLFAENIKRLKAVEISPQGNTVIISGKNEQGKSSILDSIWLACKYSAASKQIPNPIREGKDHALIVMNIGDYTITRQFRMNGDNEVTTRLSVERANGDTVKSPQALIDGFIGSLAFDPLEFMRQPPKTQREMLAEISKLNLAELDAQYKQLYDERTELNRQHKSLAANIIQIAPPTDTTSTTEVNSSDLLTELRRWQESLREAKLYNAKEVQLRERIATLEKELETLKEQYRREFEDTVNVFDEAACVAKIGEIEAQIGRAAEINARVKEVKFYNDTTAKISAIQDRLSAVESGLETIKTSRAAAIEAADLPIEGLLIEDDGVTFKGQPLSQLSTSQQIKISMVLAMAANPELRVIRIKDGSLLDADNLALIDEIAKNGDFQVWIECVDSTGKVGFYIEDGEIAAVNECTK